MNFFKSVFADDPDPPPSTSEPESSSSDSTTLPQQQQPSHEDSSSDVEPSPQSSSLNGGGGWTFGTLVKTLTTRSESVIETYRRDLKEFSSGLKNETLTLREVANRAMKELPSSIEVTATKAQGAIDSIGSTVWKSTAEIIAQGKETLLSADLDSSDDSSGRNSIASVGRYSRFDAQLRVIQCDVNTYLQEPDSGSAEDYEKWGLAFKLEEKGEEIEGLIGDNGVMSEIYTKLVPGSVDHETFWFRYYYRVHRIEQAASVRAKLVNRVASMDEEELSWDVDDDEEGEEAAELPVGPVMSNNKPVESDKLGNKDVKLDDSSKNVVDEGKVEVVVNGEIGVGDDKAEDESVAHVVEEGNEKRVNVKEPASDENTANDKVLPKDTPDSKKDELALTMGSNTNVVVSSEEKAEGKESSQNKDDSAPNKQPSQEEEELEWDEIEDLGSDDEKKVMPNGISNQTEIRKRLSVDVDDDEDLSWDIEDDDQPVKS